MKAFDRETLERVRDNVGLLINNRTKELRRLGCGDIGKRLIGGDVNGAMSDAIRLASIRGEIAGLKSVMSMLWEDIHGDDCAEQDGKAKREARVKLTTEEVAEIGEQARTSYAEAVKRVEETSRKLDEYSQRQKAEETVRRKRWWDR